MVNNIMEQSSFCEADGSSASQDIDPISFTLDALHGVHNSPLLVPVLSHINTAHVCLSYFFKNSFNIILHLQLRILEFERGSTDCTLWRTLFGKAVNLLQDRLCS
jgi:hypothetical protein